MKLGSVKTWREPGIETDGETRKAMYIRRIDLPNVRAKSSAGGNQAPGRLEGGMP